MLLLGIDFIESDIKLNIDLCLKNPYSTRKTQLNTNVFCKPAEENNELLMY